MTYRHPLPYAALFSLATLGVALTTDRYALTYPVVRFLLDMAPVLVGLLGIIAYWQFAKTRNPYVDRYQTVTAVLCIVCAYVGTRDALIPYDATSQWCATMSLALLVHVFASVAANLYLLVTKDKRKRHFP